MFRSPRTINERRQNADPLIQQFVRPKRSSKHLPDSWDDINIFTTRNWKAATKSRHQWAKHKKHPFNNFHRTKKEWDSWLYAATDDLNGFASSNNIFFYSFIEST